MSKTSRMKGFFTKLGLGFRLGPNFDAIQQQQVAGLQARHQHQQQLVDFPQQQPPLAGDPSADFRFLQEPYQGPQQRQQQHLYEQIEVLSDESDDEKDDMNSELAQLQYVPLPEADEGSNVIIIEISGKSRQNSICSRRSHKNSLTMGDTMPVVEDTSPSTTFECRNHWKDSFSGLQDYYQDEQLCDITLEVGKKTIFCHRLVLACCSPYFKAMLTSNMKESRQKTIAIHDIDGQSLEALVNFMYTSKILLTIDTVQKLLYASSLLQIEVVAEACCNFMKAHIDPSNVLALRALAELHGRFELIEEADRYTQDNFLEIKEQDEFRNISFSHLMAIIESSDILVEKESQVYEAVMRWVKEDIVSREQYLPKLISKVRLPMIHPRFLMSTVEREELIRRSHTCRDLLDEAKNYHLSLHQLVSNTSIKNISASIRARPRKSLAGVLFVAGGRGASGDPFKSIECYDLRSDRWFRANEMSTKRRHVGVVAIKGKVYAVGGHDGKEHLDSMEVFDTKTNKWKTLAPMKTKRRGVAVASIGGPLLAIGGLDDSMCFHDVERYDPDTDSWSNAARMITPRGGVAVACINCTIYAVGGNDGSTTLKSCEKYNPYFNKWTSVCDMNTRRAGAGLAALNGYLYVVGGFDDSSPLSTVERYDPKSDTWTMLKAMDTCRGGVGVSVISGKIYAVGGHNGSHYLASAERYDIDLDRWENVKDMGKCRAGSGVVTVDCLARDLSVPPPNVVSSV